jgi:hypothetical protein
MAAKSWNLLTSFLGIANHSKGLMIGLIARIQSEIGLAAKPAIIMGQEEDLQRILARSHSRKI